MVQQQRNKENAPEVFAAGAMLHIIFLPCELIRMGTVRISQKMKKLAEICLCPYPRLYW